MNDLTNLLVLWTVILLRVLIPLAIPRYPLPGILAALLLDAVDQTVFQVFTTLNLDGYQGYDKALDTYYLAVAYIATLRNWRNVAAVRIARFLFYYRLVGVVLFELLQARWLLLVFPNVFEYFFIFYELYSLRRDPRRLGPRMLLGVAAFIWIFIKLPQEYWLHVAQLDVTDVLKVNILGFPATTSWGEILRANGLIAALLLAGTAVLLYALWRALRPRLPARDWPLSFAADDHCPPLPGRFIRRQQRILARRLFDRELLEKIVLVTLLVLIFAGVLPGVEVGNWLLAQGIVLVILINTAVSEALVRGGRGWPTAVRQGAVMLAINLPLLLALSQWRFGGFSYLTVTDNVVFALLLSLIITLYDRFRPVYVLRCGAASF